MEYVTITQPSGSQFSVHVNDIDAVIERLRQAKTSHSTNAHLARHHKLAVDLEVSVTVAGGHGHDSVKRGSDVR